MDGDAGLQVAVPESFAYGTPKPFHQFQFLPSRGLEYGSKEGISRLNPRDEPTQSTNTGAQFNSRVWDGFSFMVQPETCHNIRRKDGLKSTGSAENDKLQKATEMDLRLDCRNSSDDAETETCSVELRRKQSLFNISGTQQMNLMRTEDSRDEDAGNLSLKLCPGSFSNADDVGRNTKRIRPSSPGSQSPVCQVDDCRTDLKHAKDYHRRHKVCEHHSKAPHSLVHKIMQRFCQQCSRFHPLQEFDEGKRSCRRRLAGHNKRRRKSNTDMVANTVTLSDAGRGTEFLNLVTLLSQLQAQVKDKVNSPSIEQQVINQALKKAASASPLSTNLIRDATSPASQNMNTLSGAQRSDQGSQIGPPGSLAGLSQDALLLVLKNVLGAQASATQAKVQQPQMPHHPSYKEQHLQSVYSNGHSSPEDMAKASANVLDRLPFLVNGKARAHLGNADLSDLSSRPNIHNQYLGQNASYSVETEPGSSPESNGTQSPTEQNFFPTESCSALRNDKIFKDKSMAQNMHTHFREEISSFRSHRHTPPFLDKPNGQRSESSESGSDQSPSSSSSGGQDLTGRIIFKLCDPSRIAEIPQSYRFELQKWLSVTPLFMEDYMRPGCILLTVFVSMPRRSWEELVSNLRGSLRRLLRLSHDGIWSKGRVVVQVEQQRALIVNGKVKRIRFSKAGSGPSLRSVRPLAVVAGEETTLCVTGYNLVPQTKIICVYHGRYMLHELPVASEDPHGISLGKSGRGVNTKHVQQMHFPGGPSDVFGRFFIEVEHDFLGNTLPVIVADKEICNELITLEKDIDSDSTWVLRESEGFSSDGSVMDKELAALNFLHELGWIFQSTSFSSGGLSSNVGLSRFKWLLKFAVVHDWCAVVKKLLDVLFSIGDTELEEVLHVLSEVHLVHQAVKRKCKGMVELLLWYKPTGKEVGNTNIFTPTVTGPAGFTPLHVAASMHEAEDVLEALTNDPYELGLRGWTSAYDYAGHSPEWHARNSGNMSYLELVEKKILKRHSASVNITILDVPQNPGQDSNGVSVAKTREHQIKATELPSFLRPVHTSAQACRSCRMMTRGSKFTSHRAPLGMHRPLIMMMVAVAAVCAIVTLFLKTPPHLESILYSLKWEGIKYGTL